ncbi:MAG: hypothetical protein U1D25_01915 [Hydrogenophaga sp.]|uniref:hypothetical protein n=1 Tax=Hydrogenophaga sp. TaxID=1904254 RepID=UPI00276DC339|nr:hypothetical protein [Hydrogenophaga sp.]MDP2418176.1 hypothetical protein [Hydrogenophaga sp.]MDZ4186851.1 hypothetical protein [Hydrogenophaga sp.]
MHTHRSPHGTHATQRGVTIISTMVGLTLGLLSVLAMFTLYLTQVRQIEGTSTEPGVRSRSALDGQLSLGLLALQLDLQQAGFGLTAPEWGTDLLSTTNAGGQIHAIGWRWRDMASGVVSCSGMRYVATANAGLANETGRLEVLNNPPLTPCPIDPPTPTGAGGLFAQAGVVIERVAEDIPLPTITLTPQAPTCYLGTDDPATPLPKGVLVQFQARVSLAGLPLTHGFCIYNITE